jgi:hypothetical protein
LWNGPAYHQTGELGGPGSGEKLPVVVGVHQDAHAELMGVTLTGRAQSAVLGLGQCWKQQGGKDGDDGDNHQQFDQSEAGRNCPAHSLVNGQPRVIRNIITHLRFVDYSPVPAQEE